MPHALVVLGWALVEELMKLGIVRLGRKIGLGVPSVLVFFALEALSKIGVVHEHLVRLAVTDMQMVLLGTASVVVGSSLFHVFTSILYLESDRIVPVLLFCTIWHSLTNLLVDFLPPLAAPAFVFGPWLFVLADGCIFAAFLHVGRQWTAQRPQGGKTPMRQSAGR